MLHCVTGWEPGRFLYDRAALLAVPPVVWAAFREQIRNRRGKPLAEESLELNNLASVRSSCGVWSISFRLIAGATNSARRRPG